MKTIPSDRGKLDARRFGQQMKASCLPENLVKALTHVNRLTDGHSALPILGNVLIEAREGGLLLSATNLETAITMVIGGRVEKEGGIAVPGRTLLDIAKSTKELINMSVRDKMLHISTGQSELDITGLDVKDFPPIPILHSVGEGFEVMPGDMAEAIDYVAYAVMKTGLRPIMETVHIQSVNGHIEFAASDGYRLPVYTLPIKSEVNANVPARALVELRRLIGKKSGKITVLHSVKDNDKYMAFELDNAIITTRLFQGTYPDYQQLIPKEYASRVTVDTRSLLDAVLLVKNVASRGSGVVKLISNGDMLNVSSRADDEVAQANIPARNEGDTQIAFNLSYLQVLLSRLKDGQVALETVSTSSPGVFRKVDKANYLQVIMPMFVAW